MQSKTPGEKPGVRFETGFTVGTVLVASRLSGELRRSRHRLQLLLVFGIHGFGAAAGGFDTGRCSLSPNSWSERCWCRADGCGTVPSGTNDFNHRIARIRRDVLARCSHIIGRADERLGQINRIVNDHDDGQSVAMTDDVLGHHGLVAARQRRYGGSSRFSGGGRHGQHVAFPLAGRETLPGMRGILGRMRTSIHPEWCAPEPARKYACDTQSGLCVSVSTSFQTRRLAGPRTP